jgi:hypothetical protein
MGATKESRCIMPNWCMCELKVKGKNGEIQKFLKDIHSETDENIFDFERIIPTPKELLDNSKSPNELKMAENEKKYGARDWYAWRKKNWGTKWNTDCQKDALQLKDEMCSLVFDTAWTPPCPIIDKLSEMFPTLYFEMTYYEGGQAFAGIYTAENGESNDRCFTPEENLEAYNKIAENFGMDQDVDED